VISIHFHWKKKSSFDIELNKFLPKFVNVVVLFATFSVRNKAVQHLLPHLTSSEGANNSRPTLDSSTLSCLPNLYVLNKSVDIKLSNSEKSYVKVKRCSLTQQPINNTLLCYYWHWLHPLSVCMWPFFVHKEILHWKSVIQYVF